MLDGKEDLEKQHRDSIKQLNSVVERQEKDLAKLQAEVEDLEERNRSVQAALDSAYKWADICVPVSFCACETLTCNKGFAESPLALYTL